MEKIIESKICKQCSVEFNITDKDLEFYEKVSPVFNGVKYNIPTPTLCPDCRQQRRLAWRNERSLYRRNCDATGKQIISMFSPDKKYKVYDSKVWWSDSWNPMDYGRDFDFDRGFFEQFENLNKNVPDMSLIQDEQENSQYTNDSFQSKNCYYLFTSHANEDCYYGNSIFGCKNSLEVLWGLSCENCFQIIKSSNCYGCFYGLNLNNCANCFYVTNCENCSDCSFCVELNNQKYKILNIQYEKDEYESKIAEIRKDPIKLNYFKNKYNDLLSKIPRKNLTLISCENVLGDQIENGKNCNECFDAHNINNCKFGYSIGRLEDTYDCSITGTMDKINNKVYEGISVAGVSEGYFNVSCWFGNKIFYSRNCFHSSNLFGCVGLRNKEYCILNKQYTREEYEILVPQIIEHMQKVSHIKKDEESVSPIRGGAEGGGIMNIGIEWGEFFPASISPFGYNETVAMEYYPVKITDDKKQMITEDGKKYNVKIIGESNGNNYQESSEQIIGQSSLFNWSLYESPKPEVSKIIPAVSLPDNIVDVPDDILNWAIECEVTGRPYRIIKQELEFYRKHNLPIPRRHPDERHLDRLRQRNPRRLFERKCDKCGKDMFSTFGPEREEIVYCEECYEKEVI